MSQDLFIQELGESISYIMSFDLLNIGFVAGGIGVFVDYKLNCKLFFGKKKIKVNATS